MRSVLKPLIVLICLSLLAMQWGGLHLHVSLDDHGSSLHGTHLHDADPDHHDHNADVDVSHNEAGTSWAKLLPFLVSLAVTLLVFTRVCRITWLPWRERLPSQQLLYWRPQLRAPPLASL